MRIRALVLIVSVLAFFLPTTTKALTIFSPVLELTGAPGETVSGVLKVYNESPELITVQSSLQAYEATTSSGIPIYDTESDQLPHVNWFSIIEDQLTIEPRQVIQVPFTIAIPEAATPGGYYATVFWTTQPETTGASSTTIIRERLGAQLLITVTGDIVESGLVDSVTLLPDSSWLFELPQRMTIAFSNTGNVHLKPQGTITMKTAFGGIKEWPLSERITPVLPGSTRSFDILLNQNSGQTAVSRLWSDIINEFSLLPLGPVTYSTTVTAGTNTEVYQISEATVYIIPVRLLATICGGIFVISGLWLFRNRVKKIKRSIREK